MDLETVKSIRETIAKYGGEVLNSSEFIASFGQTHHKYTNIALHSFNVAAISVLLSQRIQKLGINIDIKSIVLASLCHDLSMLEREKYHTGIRCCFLHPIDSAEIAKQIIPNCPTKVTDIIRSHMWPVSIYMPTSKEAFIVSLADKISAVLEISHHKTPYRFQHLVLLHL